MVATSTKINSCLIWFGVLVLFIAIVLIIVILLFTVYQSEKKTYVIPPKITKHEIISSSENNPWIDRLIKAIEGLSLKDHVTKSELDSTLENHVTESELRPYIAERMDCNDDQLCMSGFIRFARGEFDIRDKEIEKIKDFKCDNQVPETGLKVFGFTSADGEKIINDDLSRCRACVVKNLLCEVSNGDCDDISTETIGEDHPINGVANSRSAVIAVCKPGAQTEG